MIVETLMISKMDSLNWWGGKTRNKHNIFIQIFGAKSKPAQNIWHESEYPSLAIGWSNRFSGTGWQVHRGTLAVPPTLCPIPRLPSPSSALPSWCGHLWTSRAPAGSTHTAPEEPKWKCQVSVTQRDETLWRGCKCQHHTPAWEAEWGRDGGSCSCSCSSKALVFRNAEKERDRQRQTHRKKWWFGAWRVRRNRVIWDRSGVESGNKRIGVAGGREGRRREMPQQQCCELHMPGTPNAQASPESVCSPTRAPN